MRIALTISILFLLKITSFSQNFHGQALLPAVSKDGFYKIPLLPEISPYINSSFSNIRIIDANGAQASFVIREEGRVGRATEFVPYAIEDKTILKDSCSVLVLKNASKTLINNIYLVIRNAEILKVASLYGSDDKNTWYALKDKFTLGYVENDQGTSKIQIIDFPTSDYTYYKLWIDDKKNAPLNILHAGYYKTVPQEFRYDGVPIKQMSQENDLKQGESRVKIYLDTLRIVDRITWRVSGAPFYQRSALLYTVRETVDKKGKVNRYDDYIAAFEINTRHEKTYYFPTVKVDNLFLEITNGDNPALNFEDVKISQTSRYLVAWLKKDETYSLKFGDGDMVAPLYDLQFFNDSIPVSLSVVQPLEVSTIRPALASKGTTLFTTRVIIWMAIIVVIIALGIMSVKMIRETKPAQD